MKKLVTIAFSMVLNTTLEIEVPDKALEDNELNILDDCQFDSCQMEGSAILESNPALRESISTLMGSKLGDDVCFDDSLLEIDSFRIEND